MLYLYFSFSLESIISPTGTCSCHLFLPRGCSLFLPESCQLLPLPRSCKLFLSEICHFFLPRSCNLFQPESCHLFLPRSCNLFLPESCQLFLPRSCQLFLTRSCNLILSESCHLFLHVSCHLFLPGSYHLLQSCSSQLFLPDNCYPFLHCKKKVSDFPVPNRDVTNQTLPDQEINCSLPGRVWLVTSRLGTGNSLIFFYSVPGSLNFLLSCDMSQTKAVICSYLEFIMSSHLKPIILFLPWRYFLSLPGSCLWGETESDLWCELPSRALSFIDISWFWFRDDLSINAFFTFSSPSRDYAACSVQCFVTLLLYLWRYRLIRYLKVLSNGAGGGWRVVSIDQL
jgi:hypothetical protein